MKIPGNKGYHCYVTNITKRDIHIGDLGIKISPFQTVDLLNERHSILTVERVKKSIEQGSLFKRLQKKQLLIRQSEPKQTQRTLEVSKAIFPHRKRTAVKFEEKVFEELEIGTDLEDEDAFAEEMADTVSADRAVSIDLTKEEETSTTPT